MQIECGILFVPTLYLVLLSMIVDVTLPVYLVNVEARPVEVHVLEGCVVDGTGAGRCIACRLAHVSALSQSVFRYRLPLRCRSGAHSYKVSAEAIVWEEHGCVFLVHSAFIERPSIEGKALLWNFFIAISKSPLSSMYTVLTNLTHHAPPNPPSNRMVPVVPPCQSIAELGATRKLVSHVAR